MFIIGRLTFDPELRKIGSGTAVADLRLATGRTWVTKDGEKKEETLYIDVTVWERAAENCCQYLKKGSQVHVEGSLKMDEWSDKNTGEKRSKIKVHADRVQFLDKKGESPSSESSRYDEERPARSVEPIRRPANRPAAPTPPSGYRKPMPDPDEEGEVPF